MPTISRNSSVVLVMGNGSAGTASPSRSQMGSHPSPGVHSRSRSAGTWARTVSLCRVKASVIAVGSSNRSLSRLRWGDLVGNFGGRVADLGEDVEQHLLSLRADAVDEEAGDLLDRG